MTEKETISRSDYSECKALLDACTPLVYVHNAFRISGLAVDASDRDIKRRFDDLKRTEGRDAETEHTHAFALDPPPTIERISEAARRWEDPECRIVEEFFWFWPTQWGGGRADPALSALGNGDKDTAFRAWSLALANGNGAAAVVAKHNLAVMYHLVALDSEHYALENDFVADQLKTIAKYWRTCFKWWEELTSDETFWSLVTDRIRMLDDPRLTTGFARRMRTTLPEALDKINALLAVAFFEKDKHDLGRNQVTYMLETHQGLDDVPKTLAIVTKPLKTRVISSVEKARTAAQREPMKAAQSARDLLNAVAEPLKIIQMILPPTDYERIDLCDSVAETCLSCQIAYAQETKDWGTSLEIMDEAMVYAASQETRERLAENRAVVASNQLFNRFLDPLAASIKKADGLKSIVDKLQAVENDVLPQLRTIERLPDMTAEVYENCADMVARYARGLSVSAYNDNKDIDTAARAHELAKSIVRGSDLKKQLQDDADQLEDFKFNADLHNIVEGGDSGYHAYSALLSTITTRIQAVPPGPKLDELLEVVVHALRVFAIKECNKGRRYAIGGKAIDKAIEYANQLNKRDQKLIEQLLHDQFTMNINRLAEANPLVEASVLAGCWQSSRHSAEAVDPLAKARLSTAGQLKQHLGNDIQVLILWAMGVGILFLIFWLISLAGC